MGTKQKPLTKQQRKRQQAFDAPPKTLRIIDKFGIFPVVDAKAQSKTRDASQIYNEIQGGKVPVYLIDDVVDWLEQMCKERWFKEVRQIDLCEIFTELDTLHIPTSKLWMESRKTFPEQHHEHVPENWGVGFTIINQPFQDWLVEAQNRPNYSPRMLTHFSVIASGECASVLTCQMFFASGTLVTTSSFNVQFFVDTESKVRDYVTLQEDDSDRKLTTGQQCSFFLPCIATLAFLNVSNIEIRQEAPLRTQKIRRFERDTHKRLPLFEHRVVNLWPVRPKVKYPYVDTGPGTGVKKRFHHVTGFFRIRRGRKEWVRPHTRGDKRLGTVVSRKRIRLET